MARRKRSRLLASIALLVVAAVAALLLFADGWLSRTNVEHSREPGALPRLASTPALNVMRPAAVEVRLSGTISDASGAPIAGASVCAACTACLLGPDRSSGVCAPTDAHGVYALVDLPVGDYRLSAGAAGYRPGVLQGGAVLRVRSQGLRADGLDGVLERGADLITGVVLDGTGGPVAGAIVEAHFQFNESAFANPVLQVTVSDDEGSFSISMQRGEVRLMSRADGYAPADMYTFAPASDVQLVMTPAAEISGHVVTAKDGQPVANVRVNAVQRGIEQFAISDEQGAFRITNLNPGTFDLTAEAKGWFGLHSGGVSLEIGERVTDVLVHVVPGASVHGVVLTGEQPCSSGQVSLSPPPGLALPSLSARTDPDGKVSFDAVPPGLYDSSALCDRYQAQPGPRVAVGSHDVTGQIWCFEATAGVTIAAKTTGGMVATATWIDFERVPEPGAAGAANPRGGWTDAKGEIHFKGVAAAQYRISGPDITQPVSVEVREGDNRFDVALDARGYIDVQVERPNGEPNDDVGMIALRVDGTGVPGDAHRYDTGRYRIGPLSVGAHYVQVRDGVNPGARAPGEVQVRAGAITPIEMIYGGDSGKITGRVLDASGVPIANVWVSAEASDSAQDMLTQSLVHQARALQRRVYTDSVGHFEIANLDSRGTFSVVVTRRGGGEERQSGVSAGQHIELVLPAAATLEGVALAVDGTPLRNFRLSLIGTTNNQNITPIFGPEAGGAWQLQDVAAGEVTLTAFTMNGEQGSTVLNVSAGQTLRGIVLRIAPAQAALLGPEATPETSASSRSTD